MDFLRHNRAAWDRQVDQKNRWTVPVEPDVIARARAGEWSLLLTPNKPVPRSWYPASMRGLEVLCLASGGGQQAPVLAAAGANVTVLDNSPKQLVQDRLVAEREGLSLETLQGDMRDLGRFDAERFDLVFHPCSNAFVDDVRAVWREAHRVLRPRGVLLAGVTNPLRYLFDEELLDRGVLEVRHSIPYSDLTNPSQERAKERIARGEPLEFGHTLQDQIAGQLEAGFVLTHFFEDAFPAEMNDALSRYIATFMATRAVKAARLSE